MNYKQKTIELNLVIKDLRRLNPYSDFGKYQHKEIIFRYSIISILVSIFVESLHRYVFDNLYIQDNKKQTLTQKIKLKYYKFLFYLLPEWRHILKHNKKIFNRAYNQKRLSFSNQILLPNLNKITTTRYSDKIF